MEQSDQILVQRAEVPAQNHCWLWEPFLYWRKRQCVLYFAAFIISFYSLVSHGPHQHYFRQLSVRPYRQGGVICPKFIMFPLIVAERTLFSTVSPKLLMKSVCHVCFIKQCWRSVSVFRQWCMWCKHWLLNLSPGGSKNRAVCSSNAVTSQLVNGPTSCMFYSKTTDTSTKRNLKQICDLQHESSIHQYFITIIAVWEGQRASEC